MFYIKDYVAERCLVSSEYKCNNRIDYSPVNFDLLVFKCGFDFVFDENGFQRLVDALNYSNPQIENLDDKFLPIGNGEVSATLFKPREYLAAGNCFPVTDQGRNYILIICEVRGADVDVYKPDFNRVATDGTGVCQVPLDIKVVKLLPEKKGFIGIFKSKKQLDYSEYEFQYDLCGGYCDGDIYYKIKDFYPEEEEDRDIIIPITKKALENHYVCINCDSNMIEFGSKKRINLTKE